MSRITESLYSRYDLKEDFWNPGKYFNILMGYYDSFDDSEWNNWGQKERDTFCVKLAKAFLDDNIDKMSEQDLKDLLDDAEDSNFHSEGRAICKLLPEYGIEDVPGWGNYIERLKSEPLYRSNFGESYRKKSSKKSKKSGNAYDALCSIFESKLTEDKFDEFDEKDSFVLLGPDHEWYVYSNSRDMYSPTGLDSSYSEEEVIDEVRKTGIFKGSWTDTKLDECKKKLTEDFDEVSEEMYDDYAFRIEERLSYIFSPNRFAELMEYSDYPYYPEWAEDDCNRRVWISSVPYAEEFIDSMMGMLLKYYSPEEETEE